MNITETVKTVLQEISGLKEINLTDRLQSDMALDSFAMVTLLITIEERFAIELEESDMNPMELLCVSDVINLIERYTDNEK